MMLWGQERSGGAFDNCGLSHVSLLGSALLVVKLLFQAKPGFRDVHLSQDDYAKYSGEQFCPRSFRYSRKLWSREYCEAHLPFIFNLWRMKERSK